MNSAAALPATLSDPSVARLPATYEAAQNAIAECSRIDECRGWADKAAALASYARQAKNDTLRVLAVRIQARAIRRCGELVKQIPAATGARTDLGSVPTRSSVADEAGLSEHQRKTALRLASLPAADFDRQVESLAPPSVTQLAEQGTQSRAVETSPQSERFKAACAALHAFVRFCDANDAADTAGAFRSDDIEMARRCVTRLDQWLDRFVAHLPNAEGQ
jgi:hypothetical protein